MLKRLLVAAVVALAAGSIQVTSGPARGASPRVVIRGPRTPEAGMVTYRFEAARGSRFRCSLDSPLLEACKASFRVRLATGRHVLRVQAVSRTGQTSAVITLSIRAHTPIPSAGRVVARIGVGLAPLGLAYAGGAVWVTQHHGLDVVKIDPATNAVVGRTAVASGDEQPGRFAHLDEALWQVDYSASPGAIIRLDPATGAVSQTLTVPGEPCCSLAVGGGSVWVATPFDGPGAIYRLDAQTGAVTARIGVDQPTVGVFGAGAAWGTSGVDVIRIDATTNAVTRFSVGPDPFVQAFAAGSIWVSTDSGLVRIDPASGAVSARIRGLGGWVAFDGTSIWTSGSHDGFDGLWRIDPSSNSTTGWVPIESTQGESIGDVVAGGGAIWATTFNRGTGTAVVRIQPTDG
jgi:hypothetical protein